MHFACQANNAACMECESMHSWGVIRRISHASRHWNVFGVRRTGCRPYCLVRNFPAYPILLVLRRDGAHTTRSRCPHEAAPRISWD